MLKVAARSLSSTSFQLRAVTRPGVGVGANSIRMKKRWLASYVHEPLKLLQKKKDKKRKEKKKEPLKHSCADYF